MSCRIAHGSKAQVAYRRPALRARLSALAVAAWLSFPLPATSDIVEWTGNAPVYLVQWDEGNGLQTHEYKLFTAWNDACHAQQATAHGAICSATTYWDSNANWDRLLQPSSTDSARIVDSNLPGPAIVWVASYDSVYQGRIMPTAFAGGLYADTTIVLAGNMYLADNGYIRDLQVSLLSTLVSNGPTTIASLNGAPGGNNDTPGRFWGSGSTTVQNITAAKFDPFIERGHTLAFTGVYAGSTAPWLSDQSTFINGGSLDATALRGVINAGGSFNAFSQSIFVNTGTLTGPFTMNGVRFNNDGTVSVDHGNFEALYNGTHKGSFIAGADSTLRFGAFGGGIGHHFLPGSSVVSDGQVVFNGTSHLVEGSYRAVDTLIGSRNAQVTFKGNLGYLDRLTVNPSSWVSFDHTTGVSFGDLVINGPQAFAYLTTTTPSTAQRLTIVDGGLNTTATLTVADRFDWGSGSLYGPVTVNGTTTLGAGARTLAGTLRNAGTLTWSDGRFAQWSGRVENLAGALFDIHGDFAYGDGGGGSFDNAGVLRKSAGSGGTILPLPVDNRGTVEALAGTLGLYYGGRHSGRFSAAPDARIVLAGDNVIAGAVATSGRVDVTSGSFSIADGGSYVHASGNSMSVAQLNVTTLGRFDNNGWFGISDWNNPAKVSNQGQLNNRGSLAAVSLANRGQIVNAAGADMTIHFDAGVNLGSINNAGSFSAANLDNRGMIVNSNSMTLNGTVVVSSVGSIGNTGTLNLWGDTMVAGRIDNSGAISVSGNLLIDAGGKIVGTGLYNDGLGGATTRVNGLLEAQGGIFINGVLAGSGTVVGNLTFGQFATWKPGNSPGTMTVQGDVDIPLMAPAGMGWPGYETAPGNVEIQIASGSVYDRLQISGNASLNALVDFVLLPGYTPSDGDDFQWLNAASISGFAVPRVLGLPTGWHGDLIADPLGGTMRFVLSNEPAVDGSSQIPLAGSVGIPVGTVASNWDWAGTPSLERLDNAGWFINRPGATAWIGDLANQAGGVIANHGTLFVTHGVDNAGELRNKPGAELTVFGGITNSGHLINSGTLNFGDNNFGNLTNAGGARIDNHGVINRGYFAQIVNQGSFIVDGTVNNDYGWYYSSGTIQNTAGRFVVAPGGLVTGSGSYYQFDQALDPASVPVTQVDGRLAAADIRIYGGFLTGSGTLAGAVTLSATVQPGNSPGTLTIEGNLTASSAVFEIELAGIGNADRLHVTGSAAFSDGNYAGFILRDGYRPHAGDSFVWLVADGGANGLDRLSWYVVDGNRVWSRDYPMPGMPITFSGDRIAFGSAAPVPEIPPWAMWLAGLGGLCSYLGRRRRRGLMDSGRRGAFSRPAPVRGSCA